MGIHVTSCIYAIFCSTENNEMELTALGIQEGVMRSGSGMFFSYINTVQI